MIEYSDVYKDTWECNLLGMHPNAVLPDYLVEGTYALVDICKYPVIGNRVSQKAEFNFSLIAPPFRSTLLIQELQNVLFANLPESLENLRLKNIKTNWKK